MLGSHIGASLVPDASFAVVPYYSTILKGKRFTDSSFSLDSSTINDDSGFIHQEEENEEPGYATIPLIQNPRKDGEQEKSSIKENLNITNTLPKLASASIESLYAVPNKKPLLAPIKITKEKIQEQIKGLNTLIVMQMQTSKSCWTVNAPIRRNSIQYSDSEDSCITSSEKFNPMETKQKNQYDFLKMLQSKLEQLRIHVLETLDENISIGEERKKWSTELAEANKFIQENLILKQDLQFLETTTNTIQIEAEKAKYVYSAAKNESDKYNQLLIEENVGLKEKVYELLSEREIMMPIEEHHRVISEIKKLLEDLKSKHTDNTSQIKKDLLKSRKETSRMSVTIIGLMEEISLLKTDNKSLKEGFESSLSKCYHLLKQLTETQMTGESAMEMLTELTSKAERSAMDQNNLVKKIRVNKILHTDLVEALLKRNVTLGRLQESIKEFKSSTFEKLQEMEKRMEDTKAIAEEENTKSQREIHRLKQSLQQKNKEIEKHQNQILNLEQEVETVWRSISRD